MGGWGLLATCYSLLATDYLPLATDYLPLATDYLPLATDYLPLATAGLLQREMILAAHHLYKTEQLRPVRHGWGVWPGRVWEGVLYSRYAKAHGRT